MRRDVALTALGPIALIVAIVAAGCASVWSTSSPGGLQHLTGQWTGWASIARLGNGPASMTVKDDGAFEGVVRLEDEERPFRGAISVLGPHAMRYDGTFGDGIATVAAERGRLTLKLVPDGGGGVATFLPAQPAPK